jgi:hypothetical protein
LAPMPRPTVALLFACLLACGSGSSPDAKPGAEPEASPAAVCAEKVAAMRTLFAHGPGEPTHLFRPPGMELPAASGGEPVVEATQVLVLADGGLRLHQLDYPTPAELRATLAMEFEHLKQSGTPARLALVADARAPVTVIREVVEGLGPEVALDLVVQLAGDTVPPAPPMPASVAAAVQEVRPDQRAMRIASVTQQAIGGCKPIAELYERLAVMGLAERGKALLDELPGAVEACRCEGVDVETLTSAVWSVTGKTAPSERHLPLRLSGEEGAEEVALPAAATAADLARVVEARGASPFRLVLAG